MLCKCEEYWDPTVVWMESLLICMSTISCHFHGYSTVWEKQNLPYRCPQPRNGFILLNHPGAGKIGKNIWTSGGIRNETSNEYCRYTSRITYIYCIHYSEFQIKCCVVASYENYDDFNHLREFSRNRKTLELTVALNSGILIL